MPDSSNHSLYLIRLFNSSCPEGHCGGNQQPDSICLSPPKPNFYERFARPCLVVSCLVLSCLVLSCLVLSCLVLSCLSLSLFLSFSLSLFLSFSLSLFLSFSLSLFLPFSVFFLCLSLSPCDVVCCVVWCVSLWSWCCWWSWCVFSVCVCCGTLKKRRETRMWLLSASVLYIQNVPVYAGTTRTCVETCARGAGTHGGRFERTHQGVFESTHGGQGVIASSAYQNLPTYGYHVLQRFTEETFGTFLFSSVRID